MNESRREFIRKLGSLFAVGIPAAALTEGCGSAGLPVYRNEIQGGVADLYLKWYPELSRTGGVIELLVGGETGSLYVARVSFSRFAALAPACTADGCRVVLDRSTFKCPCDGSVFDLDGRVVSGPAVDPLRSYRTQFLDSSVRIFLS